MKKRLRYFFAAFAIALRRLWHQKGLVACMLLGLIAAVALTVSIPIYADAISYRILNENLSIKEGWVPPFSFLFRYVGSWGDFIEWEDCAQIDEFITHQAAFALGLPQEMLVRHYKTDKMRLFPASEAKYADMRKPLAYVSVGFISDLEAHITLLDGQFPRPVFNNTDPIEVMVTFSLVEQLGIQVGEEYIVYFDEPQAEGATVQRTFQHLVRIAGIWQANDPHDPYWFYHQSAFDSVLLIPEASYTQMAREMKGEVSLALWSLICDGSAIRTQNAGPLIARIGSTQHKAHALLTGIELARSPAETLSAHVRIDRLLNVVLYVFSLPILGLVLYFITLISGMIVQRQRNEIAMLRSRGMTTWQVIGMYLLEGVIVSVLSMAAGTLLGERFAQVMGLTRSFLVLENRPFLPTVLSWSTLRFGVLALVASILASIGPAVKAAKETIVTYKQDQSRMLKAPFWQRAFLDVILLVPALYGYYLLEQRGTISFTGGEGQTSSPFSNPLLFLPPMLLIFALALLSIRIFPLIMHLLSWLVNLWKGAVPVLVFRHLSRTAKQYIGPLLLLILTLSLAIFTASMARTLDDHIVAKAYYDIGADYRLVETGETPAEMEMAAQSAQSGTGEEPGYEGPQWLFLPVGEHLNIPGVQAASRVWDKEATARLRGNNVDVRMVGIDRIDFSKTAFFRHDFAPASLGALMNALAVRDDGILVSRDVLDYGLEVGSKIDVIVPLGEATQIDFTIVGVVDLFPRLYPEEGPFLVGNLDHIFNVAGGLYPYDVWLKTSSFVDTWTLGKEARELGLIVGHIQNARQNVDRMQLEPNRQGVFGLLSVGFIVSASVTVLGFLLYAYISFRQRYIEWGVLRAVGLSTGQMALSLVAEQLTLILTGAGIGTGIGVFVSRLLIPFLQVEGGEHALTPPFIVQVAWTEITYIYTIFGAMFLAAVIALFFALRRMRIFEAIKLGDAA